MVCVSERYNTACWIRKFYSLLPSRERQMHMQDQCRCRKVISVQHRMFFKTHSYAVLHAPNMLQHTFAPWPQHYVQQHATLMELFVLAFSQCQLHLYGYMWERRLMRMSLATCPLCKCLHVAIFIFLLYTLQTFPSRGGQLRQQRIPYSQIYRLQYKWKIVHYSLWKVPSKEKHKYIIDHREQPFLI